MKRDTIWEVRFMQNKYVHYNDNTSVANLHNVEVH